MVTSKIIATGRHVPDFKVTNTDLSKIMDTNDEWIQKRTGIEARRFSDKSTTYMATEAAFEAVASLDVETIDCIIVATYTPDTFIPTVANQVRSNLGIKRSIPSFDINAACSGFLYAFQNAHAFIKAEVYKRVLVIGADFNSRYLDFADRSTAILFGDGAGAIVMEAASSGTIDCVIGGETDVLGSITAPNLTDHPNPLLFRNLIAHEHFKMKGSDVFKFAVKTMEIEINTILKKHNLSMDDIDYVVSHQANQRILDSAARALKVPTHKFLSNVKGIGNTSAGSVPILLDEAVKDGRIQPGMKIIMIAFGGGLTYGTALLDI